MLGVEKTIELKELKVIYRNLMKEWHPDKFQDDDVRKAEAEEKSKALIEAYNFLISIAPETREANLAEYIQTTTSCALVDFQYKSRVLKVEFSDGSKYEYFEVPSTVYNKLINSDAPGRFIRRNISETYVYRKISNATAL